MSGTCSSSSLSSWSTLLSDLSLSDAYIDISNEARFRIKFKEECSRNKEPNTERLLARFQRLHAQIISFINTLDKSIVPTQTKLSSVFWAKAFEVVAKAFEAGQKDKLFKEYLPKFSDAFPALPPASLPLFPDDENVQRPLQKIFVECMECYTLLTRVLDPKERDVDAQSFFIKIGTVTKSVSILKEQWETATAAALDAQIRAVELLSRRDNFSSYAASSISASPRRTTLVKFELIATLGKGRYGTVYKEQELSTKGFYAVKVIQLDDHTYRDRLIEQFQTESHVMRQLRHHHIAAVQFPFIEDDCLKLYMSPVADGNLLQYMEGCCSKDQDSPPDMTNLSSWFGCLVSALHFAHVHKVIHKDIKPTNILVKESQVLLTDFGCAEVFNDFNIPRSEELDEQTGTAVYWPPEMTSGSKRDVWSLGCVFSEMLTIRQGRTLKEFAAYRRNDDQESPHAFRGSLDKVKQWLNETVPRGNTFAALLKSQTLLMLEPKVELRKEAIDIKRGLRSHWDSDLAFCTTCS